MKTIWKLQPRGAHNVSSFYGLPPEKFFATKKWRKTAIWTLVKSAPTQNLIPPPKAMKFLDAPSITIVVSYSTSHLHGLKLRGFSYLEGFKCTAGGQTMTPQPAGIV
ncbi:hypothetical protein Ancab_032598 [Ancistrocladus abbreviatus]